MARDFKAVLFRIMRWAAAALVPLQAAHATLITFDDLPYDPNVSFFENPVTDQYASKGLLIQEGFVSQGSGAVSSPNYLLGGPFLQFNFTGTLPTFVSMYVGASLMDSVLITVTGPGGAKTHVTDGAYKNGDVDFPYRSQQFVSFRLPGGISQINFDAFYFRPADAQVDNVYFTTAVPEPASYAMLAAGLLLTTAYVRGRQGRRRA